MQEHPLIRQGDWTSAVLLPHIPSLDTNSSSHRLRRIYSRNRGSTFQQELTALRGVPLFQDLDFDVQERMAHFCTLHAHSKNQEIGGSSGMVNSFHFLVTGYAKLQMENPRGRSKIVDIVGPGSNLDEYIPMQTPGHNLRVIAVGASRVLRVPRNVVLEALQVYPALALRFIDSMSRRMGQLLQELNSHVSESAMQRFVRYVVQKLVPQTALEKDEPVTITLPVGKAVVASRLSLSPEYFSRMLRQLERDQLITVENRNIAIPSVSKLVYKFGPAFA